MTEPLTEEYIASRLIHGYGSLNDADTRRLVVADADFLVGSPAELGLLATIDALREQMAELEEKIKDKQAVVNASMNILSRAEAEVARLREALEIIEQTNSGSAGRISKDTLAAGERTLCGQCGRVKYSWNHPLKCHCISAATGEEKG